MLANLITGESTLSGFLTAAFLLSPHMSEGEEKKTKKESEITSSSKAPNPVELGRYLYDLSKPNYLLKALYLNIVILGVKFSKYEFVWGDSIPSVD